MTRFTKQFLQAIILATAIIATFTAHAQDTISQHWKTEKRVNILFGLAQPILASGFNIEGNYIYHRFIFDYSHGASLDFKGNTVTSELRRQGIAVHEPWTTGFGIGYRVKEWINIRVEPKWHKFEFYYEGEPQNAANEITSYHTFSLGVGVYGSFRPFKRKDNFLKGILIAPSIRFWPTMSSSLKDDTYTYYNKNTKAIEQIKTLDPGTGFTPLVLNVSIGYSISFKKKR